MRQKPIEDERVLKSIVLGFHLKLWWRSSVIWKNTRTFASSSMSSEWKYVSSCWPTHLSYRALSRKQISWSNPTWQQEENKRTKLWRFWRGLMSRFIEQRKTSTKVFRRLCWLKFLDIQNTPAFSMCMLVWARRLRLCVSQSDRHSFCHRKRLRGLY